MQFISSSSSYLLRNINSLSKFVPKIDKLFEQTPSQNIIQNINCLRMLNSNSNQHIRLKYAKVKSAAIIGQQRSIQKYANSNTLFQSQNRLLMQSASSLLNISKFSKETDEPSSPLNSHQQQNSKYQQEHEHKKNFYERIKSHVQNAYSKYASLNSNVQQKEDKIEIDLQDKRKILNYQNQNSDETSTIQQDQHLNSDSDQKSIIESKNDEDYKRLAMQALMEKDYEQAYWYYELARYTAIETYGPEHISSVTPLFCLLDVYARYANLRLPEHQNILKLSEIADVYDTCQNLLEQNGNKFPLVEQSVFYTKMGNLQFSLGRMDLAIAQFEKARDCLLELLNKNNEPKHNINKQNANSTVNQTETESENYNLSNELRTSLFYAYNSIGVTNAQLSNYELALESYEKAHLYKDSYFLRINIAQCQEATGQMHEAVGNYELALKYIAALKDQASNHNQSQSVDVEDTELFYIHAELGQLYSNSNQAMNSLKHLHKAMELLSTAMLSERSKQEKKAWLLQDMGNNLVKTNQKKEALKYFIEALKMSNELFGERSIISANIKNMLEVARTNDQDKQGGVDDFYEAADIMVDNQNQNKQ